MKIASVIYLPPPTAYTSALAIVENLKRFPPRHPLIVFSEYDHKWPGQVIIKGSPEFIRGRYHKAPNPDRLALNNLVWLTGMKIAHKQGITHVLNLEADCRVGVEGWDDRIFDEYFTLGRPCIAAGTLAVYNPCGSGLRAAKRWEALVAQNMRQNVPIATYGWRAADTKGASCVFPNGALSVMDMGWVTKLFQLTDTVAQAQDLPPWDMEFGTRAWKLFEDDTYYVMGQLNTVYSGYGDALTTEAERMEMLRAGKCVAIHQIKGIIQP